MGYSPWVRKIIRHDLGTKHHTTGLFLTTPLKIKWQFNRVGFYCIALEKRTSTQPCVSLSQENCWNRGFRTSVLPQFGEARMYSFFWPEWAFGSSKGCNPKWRRLPSRQGDPWGKDHRMTTVMELGTQKRSGKGLSLDRELWSREFLPVLYGILKDAYVCPTGTPTHHREPHSQISPGWKATTDKRMAVVLVIQESWVSFILLTQYTQLWAGEEMQSNCL